MMATASVANNCQRNDIWLSRDLLNGGVNLSENDTHVALCGHCGHKAQAAKGDVWDNSDRRLLAELLCPNCFEGCFQYSIIIAKREVAEQMTDKDATQYVLDRATWEFWTGHVVSETAIDDSGAFLMSDETGNPVHIRRGTMNMDWTPYCPVCGVEDDGDTRFDFHHWDYENDIGVQICRDCHNYAHGGKTVREQKEASGRSWKKQAADRLLRKMKDEGGAPRATSESLQIPPQTLSELPSHLCD